MSLSNYQGLSDVSLEAPQTKLLDNSDYMAKAVAQYDPSYNMKVTGLQNTLANNLSNLENSKATIDANYDKAAASQNLNSQLAENNLNNDALNRGLSRSSIITSGLASAELANNRALSGIQADKTNSLNTVATNEANTSNGYLDQANTLAANRLDDTQTLADKLKQTDLTNYDNELNANRDYYIKQLDYNNAVNQMNDSNYWKNQDQNNWQQNFDLTKSNDSFNNNLNQQKFNLDKDNSEFNNNLNQGKFNLDVTNSQVSNNLNQEKFNLDKANSVLSKPATAAASSKAMDYLNDWASGKVQGLGRADAGQILNWIGTNSGELNKQGVDVDTLRKWATNTFHWYKDGDGNWIEKAANGSEVSQ